jgi:hypothetical protein
MLYAVEERCRLGAAREHNLDDLNFAQAIASSAILPVTPMSLTLFRRDTLCRQLSIEL